MPLLADKSKPGLITVEAFMKLCAETLPAAEGFHAEEIGFGTCYARLAASEMNLRAGGTISGPAQMALADYALYGAVQGAVGLEPMAVTTSFNINYVHRPKPGDLIADCRLIKIGKRFCVGEADLLDTEGLLVAHATGTYALPPEPTVKR